MEVEGENSQRLTVGDKYRGGGGTDERNYGEPETACMLDIDGIQRVPVGRSTRNDIEGSDSEVWEGTKIG